eukprot:m.383704 g.383704  ORF g.383704 m.383704 type:complete len:190 (-) comp20047_c1_seq13:106-675(-)
MAAPRTVVFDARETTDDADSDLVDAFEHSLDLAGFREPLVVSGDTQKLHELEPEDDEELLWRIGDLCRATYSADGQLYDATVVGIDGLNETCTVDFDGYDEQEVKRLEQLLPRKSAVAEPLASPQATASTPGVPIPRRQDAYTQPRPISQRQPDRHRQPSAPRPWQAGDTCKCVWSIDGNEVEEEKRCV